jgi:hypothetical protein
MIVRRLGCHLGCQSGPETPADRSRSAPAFLRITQLAKQFIDGSLKGRSKLPCKAAYARALKLARQAMEELT